MVARWSVSPFRDALAGDGCGVRAPTTGYSMTSRARSGTEPGATSAGTYDKDAGPNNQRLHLNGTRVAQRSDTLPLDLNSNPLGIGRRVSGIADP
jgi:hypothetical protein